LVLQSKGKSFTITVFVLDSGCEFNQLLIGRRSIEPLAGGAVDGATYKQRKDLPILLDLARV
jgi:hypothetical protein